MVKLSKYVGVERGRQTQLAKAIGCQSQLVWQWATGVRPVPIARCPPIEAATNGLVRRWDLRPDDWYAIWPELVGALGAPKLALGSADEPALQSKVA